MADERPADKLVRGGSLMDKLKAHRKDIEDAQEQMEGQAKSTGMGIPKPAQAAGELSPSTIGVIQGFRRDMGKPLGPDHLKTLQQIDSGITMDHIKKYGQ